MSDEFQTKTKPALPLIPLQEDRMSPINNPLIMFDVRTPEQIQKQIKLAEDTARFFKSHWLWFYISAGMAIWRGYLQSETNRAIKRLDKEIHEKKIIKNPKRKKK